MATQVAEQPPKGLTLIKRDSTPQALAIAGLGALSVVLFFIGTPLVLMLYGFTPVESLEEGLTSSALRTLLIAAAVIGFVALAWGLATYKKMENKTTRSEAVTGAVLGVQGLVLCVALLIFTYGDVEAVAQNYLDFEIVGPLLGEFVTGAWNTIKIAFLSQFFGLLLGLVLAIFAISKTAVVRAPARVYINVFRGTPLVLQLVLIGIGLPIGLGIRIDTLQAAIIALSLNTGAYAAEVFRAGIQSIERGQLEAARGLGMTYMQSMRHAVIPQAVRRVVPPLMNEFVILIKDTSLVLVLGLSAAERDLMNVGAQAQANTFDPTFYIVTGIGYLIITLPLIRIVNIAEKRMRSGLVGVGA